MNFALNKPFVDMVTGKYKKLEVINSGSFVDLDGKTMDAVLTECVSVGIEEIHKDNERIDILIENTDFGVGE